MWTSFKVTNYGRKTATASGHPANPSYLRHADALCRPPRFSCSLEPRARDCRALSLPRHESHSNSVHHWRCWELLSHAPTQALLRCGTRREELHDAVAAEPVTPCRYHGRSGAYHRGALRLRPALKRRDAAPYRGLPPLPSVAPCPPLRSAREPFADKEPSKVDWWRWTSWEGAILLCG